MRHSTSYVAYHRLAMRRISSRMHLSIAFYLVSFFFAIIFGCCYSFSLHLKDKTFFLGSGRFLTFFKKKTTFQKLLFQLLAMSQCVSPYTLCLKFNENITKEQIRGKIENKHSRMKTFVQHAYDLINTASEQINWDTAYASQLIVHTTEISGKLTAEKSRADDILNEIQTDLLTYFCDQKGPRKFKDQMESDVYPEFEFKARIFIDGMMTTRYMTFGIDMLVSSFSVPLKPMASENDVPSDWHDTVEMYRFDKYCESAKRDFDGYLEETSKNVHSAEMAVIGLVEAGSELAEAERTMLKDAVQHQINQFNRKVAYSQLCYRPAEQYISSDEKIHTVMQARIGNTVYLMKHNYGLVLMRELKNVSYQFELTNNKVVQK